MRLKLCCSLVLNSSTTTVCSAWRVLLESTAFFSQIFLIVLRIIWSSMDFARMDMSSNGIVLRSRVLTSSTRLVLGVRLTCSVLTCSVPTYILLDWICSSHRSFLTLPSFYMYCFSNRYKISAFCPKHGLLAPKLALRGTHSQHNMCALATHIGEWWVFMARRPYPHYKHAHSQNQAPTL